MISTNIVLSFQIFFILTISIKVILLLLNIKHIKENIQQVPEQFKQFIDNEGHQKAQRYTITKNKYSLISIGIDSALVLFWIFGGGLNYLYQLIQMYNFDPLMEGVVYIISFSIIGGILGIPQSIYYTFVIEEKYGFNKTTPKLFCIDLLKGFILSLIIGIPFLYAVLYFLNYFGPNWWLYTWVFFIAFQFFIMWAYPKFIAPLFNKFTPLDNKNLTEGIENLSQKINLKFKDYFVINASIRSSHGNAYFSGFGKNKRIVFYDTLLKTLEDEEVISVLAHELGHLKKKHILKSLIIGSVFSFIGLYLLGQLYRYEPLYTAFGIDYRSSYMALVIFLMIIPYYTYLMTPISSWFSRKNEFEADEFAAVNASAKKLISALLKMYKDNSSSLTPHPVYSKFYYSHPPANERVRFLEKFDS